MLNKDYGLKTIQAMPFTPEKAGLTGGVYTKIGLIHCVFDGTITVESSGGVSKVLTMESGDIPRSVSLDSTITINSGTFDLD